MNSNVYIVCMGRSGSTLLRQMLDMHPSIISPPESFFVLHLMDKYGKVVNWTPKIKNEFVTDLYTDRPFRLIWNIPKEHIQEALDRAPASISFIEASNIVRSCYAPNKGKEKNKIFVDKNPIYSILFNKLISAHKSAKIIHLIRDPRGVINGQIHTFKRKDVFALGHFWNTRNATIEVVSKELGIDYLLVRFEDLVNTPKETIKSICTFIGVDYSDKILEYNKRNDKFFSNKTKHYRDKHISTQKPLSKTISEKWINSLNEKQLSKIAYTTAPIARKYGYLISPEDPKVFYSSSLAISKIKLSIMVAMIRLYFSLPLIIRKSILYFRSKIFDHKYKYKS